ncbi:hypothetical protein DFR58_103175 [Anaerobacterium chartisolvens]|uniref:Uncharacterized protein n=1 Tax=Anaerobacterium chartisolvens TaxID=1297424 RepID=A0A369BD02_9FIRM|nr:hypothetical protein [Anaerobacterium chartisolvens]RCX19429.1 hypothetical protein DFR58_103175 [Anaerobacterium chartisolvens]
MSVHGHIIAILIVVWTGIYTFSYGIWTCKRKNILGGIMLMLLALVVIVLPVCSIVFWIN